MTCTKKKEVNKNIQRSLKDIQRSLDISNAAKKEVKKAVDLHWVDGSSESRVRFDILCSED